MLEDITNCSLYAIYLIFQQYTYSLLDSNLMRATKSRGKSPANLIYTQRTSSQNLWVCLLLKNEMTIRERAAGNIPITRGII